MKGLLERMKIMKRDVKRLQKETTEMKQQVSNGVLRQRITDLEENAKARSLLMADIFNLVKN